MDKGLKVTLADISLACGVSAETVRRWSKQQSWPTGERVGKGQALTWPVTELPETVELRSGSVPVQANVIMYLVKAGVVLQPAKRSETQPEGQTVCQRIKKVSTYNREALWTWYETRPQTIKDEGTQRAAYCLQVRALLDAGLKVRPALATVARTEDIAPATLKRWWYGDTSILGAANVEPSDYAAALAPRHAGCQKSADLSPEAWDYIKADWLRPEQPSVAAVYRRAQYAAEKHGWVLPSQATVSRRLEALPWQIRVLARQGEQELKRRLPHVTRLKSSLHAMEAVNADGHVFDLRVVLPSGDVGRPVIVAWQDIYSGKILAWRIGETFNHHIVRLAFGELVENYGIPEHAFLDNGREFANKWLSGGAKTRYRFKIKEDDPLGVFVQMGMTLHWTTPYHGQSKPIERAWKDLCCENIAKHPAFTGAYTGNSPGNKPSNYGERVLTWDEFEKGVSEGIAEHNARLKRETPTARGRSFDVTFAESYAMSTIRKATAEQRRLWLLSAEGVKVRTTGHIAIFNNLYFADELPAYIGRKVVVRFDPTRLSEPVHLYDLSGKYIGQAECTQVNFMDVEGAGEHARANAQRVRATKDKLKAENKISAIEAAQQLPNIITQLERPTSGAVAPLFAKPKRVANGGYQPSEEGGLRSDERHVLNMLDALAKRQPIAMD
jgi:putative transposase